MKRFQDFHTYKKAFRKYWKRYARKTKTYSKVLKKKYTCYWFDKEWCCYYLTEMNLLDKNYIKNEFRYDISDDEYDESVPFWKSCYGKDVELSWNNSKSEGVFYGFSLTNISVYYLIKTDTEYLMVPLYYNIKKRDE